MNIVRKESPELLINFRNLNDSTIRFLTRESVIRRRRQSRRDLNTRKSKQESTCRLFHELIDPKTPLYHLFHQTKKENSRKYHKLSHHTFPSRGKKKTCSKTRYERFIYGVSTYREREGEREKGTADRGITSENHRCKLFPLHSGQPRASVSACRYIAIAECFSRCYISSWP